MISYLLDRLMVEGRSIQQGTVFQDFYPVFQIILTNLHSSYDPHQTENCEYEQNNDSQKRHGFHTHTWIIEWSD